MHPIFKMLCLGLILAVYGCGDSGKTTREPISVTFLQINDVYEITALENGTVGGMAKVATLRKQLLAENPNTVTVLSGDFLNPSGMGQVIVDGQKLYGKQMVDVMNAVGIDWVTFGNHEFDLKEAPLLDRINESKFGWISANVSHLVDSVAQPFQKNGVDIPPYAILNFPEKNSDTLRIGIISVTLSENQPAYTRIGDFIEMGKSAYEEVQGKCDFVIAITHLELEEDEKFAEAVPGLKLIMGGHEHTMQHAKVGETEIYKADANAKTAFVHRLTWDPEKNTVVLTSENIRLDANIEEDAAIAKSVQSWVEKVNDGLRAQGFDPDSIIANITEPLDGLESSNRTHRTNLGTLISNSMIAAYPGAEFALLGSGSVRIDDMVVGDITQYDIIRILPFGGATVKVKMPGTMLEEMLALGTGDELKGNGGYLQYAGLAQGPNGKWMVGKNPLNSKKTYTFATGDYLIQFENAYLSLYEKYKGKYTITAGNDPKQTDVRKGLIEYLANGGM